MMIGIRKIATYIPADYESNIGRMYGEEIINENFLQKKNRRSKKTCNTS